jgi:N utilization substance protein A
MTREELDEQLDRSVSAFSNVPHVSDELAELLVSQGFFSFDDLSVIEPDQLQELSGLTPEECDEIVAYADVESEREEREAAQRKHDARAARAAAAEKDEAPVEGGGEGAQAEEAVPDLKVPGAEVEAASGSAAEMTGEVEPSEEPETETAEAEAEAAAESADAGMESGPVGMDRQPGDEPSAHSSDNGAETAARPEEERTTASSDPASPTEPG